VETILIDFQHKEGGEKTENIDNVNMDKKLIKSFNKKRLHFIKSVVLFL